MKYKKSLQMLRFLRKINVKGIIQFGIPGPQGAFSDNVTPDVDGFINEPVVQCDISVVKNTFVYDSK